MMGRRVSFSKPDNLELASVAEVGVSVASSMYPTIVHAFCLDGIHVKLFFLLSVKNSLFFD